MIRKQLSILGCTLYLLILLCPVCCFADNLNDPAKNIGAMFKGNGTLMTNLKGANSAFIGAGCIIIVCATVSAIKNAKDATGMTMAIVNPLILTILMGMCMDGTGNGGNSGIIYTTGLVTETQLLGNTLASEVNPDLFDGSGNFSLKNLYQGSGSNVGLNKIEDALHNGMDSNQKGASTFPDSTGNPPANTAPPPSWIGQIWDSAVGFVTHAAALVENALDAVKNPGALLLGVLLDFVYMVVYAIVQFLVFIALWVSCVIMDIMLTLQNFLLLLSSVFLPLFIAALSLGSTQSIGINYIKSVIAICCWPLGWAAGHLGTIALNQMAFDNIKQMLNGQQSVSSVLTAFIILLLLPFWIIVVTLCAPSAMGKMITEGGNFASAIAKGAGQQAASTVGGAAKLGAKALAGV